MTERDKFKLYLGPQTEFAQSPSDIAIFCGGCGAGATHALLIEAARMVNLPEHRALVLCRHYPQIDGLWEKASPFYQALGGELSRSKMIWTFPSGATIRFRHLATDESVNDFGGLSVTALLFDNLEDFSEQMF